MSVFHNNILAGASGASGAAEFKIERSLRFNSADSSYLNRTPSSAGNRRTFTLSGWIKRSSFGVQRPIFSSYAGAHPTTALVFNSNDNLWFFDYNSSYNFQLITSAVFRDPSAWLHFVVAVDTTQATASNRVKIYINGGQVTAFGTSTYPSQNFQLDWNSATEHNIGKHVNILNGYLAEIHFVDGTQLAASDFGEYDDNNVWQAKEYSGSHGTNGFYLKFADNSSNAALGTDSSGNSNTWTVNNFAVSAPGLATAGEGFKTILYSGNGSTTRAHTGVGFQPDLVWIKCRSQGFHNRLFDVVRGFTTSNVISSNLTNISGDEVLDSQGYVSAVGSDGFTTNGSNSGGANVNKSGETYVAWCWKAGGSPSSNTNGTITSSVSANNTYGFSIVTYTGNSTAGSTVGHGLSTAPSMIWIKNRSRAINWAVGHSGIDGFSNGKVLRLNTDQGIATNEEWFNDTDPTSSVFTVKNNFEVNYASDNYVAYCWSEVSGFSKFGSYSGGTNPKTITTGFKPAWILIKRTDGSNQWVIIDSTRGATKKLQANRSDAENNATYVGGDSNNTVEFLTDGFKLTTTNAETNGSGQTHIFAAYAQAPSDAIIDSLIDTPMDYTADSGNNGGNYCTLNPIDDRDGATYTDGNLQVDGAGGNFHYVGRASFGVSSGKFYWEATINSSINSTYYPSPGIASMDENVPNQLGDGAGGHAYMANGQKYTSATLSSYGASFTQSDVIGFALDMDAGTLTAYKNGTSQGTMVTGLTGTWAPSWSHYQSTSLIYNFGQRPFAISSVPTGYKSLCTTNLADPTIADGSTVFDAKTYSGTGSTQSITGLAFSPDLVWIKNRSVSDTHAILDTHRGTNTVLSSNLTNGDRTEGGSLTAFNSDGFTVGSYNDTNRSSSAFVAWTWDAGTSAASNTDGTMTSSVRANTSAGFSMCTYTSPNSSSNQSFGHGLNAKPNFVIVKNRDSSYNWDIYHSSLGYNSSLIFTDAGTRSGAFSAEPTSTVVNTKHDYTHVNTDDYIAYCWTAVEGYSAFGSYTGNGSSNGPFVALSFAPKWVMVKGTSSSTGWRIWDSEREPNNPKDKTLHPFDSQTETHYGADDADFLSNGFKIRNTGSYQNTNSQTYIYAAFAEHPFKTARAR